MGVKHSAYKRKITYMNVPWKREKERNINLKSSFSSTFVHHIILHVEGHTFTFQEQEIATQNLTNKIDSEEYIHEK